MSECCSLLKSISISLTSSVDAMLPNIYFLRIAASLSFISVSSVCIVCKYSSCTTLFICFLDWSVEQNSNVGFFVFYFVFVAFCSTLHISDDLLIFLYYSCALKLAHHYIWCQFFPQICQITNFTIEAHSDSAPPSSCISA